jgi:signal recognition particle subunit SRP54
MMSGFGQDLGMLGNIPGMKNLAMARNVRRAMKNGQIPGMPGGMPGMPGGLPGMPGMGFPGLFGGAGAPGGIETPRMKVMSKSEKNARKNDRKRERDARKKNKHKR